VETLFAIAPHMLMRQDFRRWAQLLCDALNLAYDLKDDDLLTRIYTLLGQSYLIEGDVRPARIAFDMAIERAAEKHADELMLLATIGLLKTQTYQPSEEMTPLLVAHALALSARLDDPTISAWLHLALANFYTHRAEPARALGYGMTALGYWFQRGNALEIGKAAQAVASAYRSAMLLKRAREAIDTAHFYLWQTSNLPYRGIVFYERGAIDLLAERYDTAEEWLELAAAAFDALEW
jgi:hypothetical protein